ncbi:Nitrogen regulatory PII-like isoform 1 [Hibiscus syriacus]|uniref:Nitrogen regulatory PII-like isoform 1 n=1 Tax=Hibiscus syriacus TaxID=106335 RepID=A0A6A2X989_HIBSY|nr:Nitrogen regulatory PII-like isoform 1 [Hibiscus syriacus]
MVEKKHHYFANANYLKRLQSGDLDPAARQEAIDFIRKVHGHFSFGPLCGVFINEQLGQKGKAWTIQLLGVTCLSLAAKMEETQVPLLIDLQVGECKFVFEGRTKQRMELLVLSTVSWKMQAITPFSFIDYFLYKLNDDKIPPRRIELLEFKPSEIAAAVAISVERVIKRMREMSLVGGNNATVPPPKSPIGVPDATCLSYISDDSNSPDTKRRKINRPCEMGL